jgi:hypothetical protein
VPESESCHGGFTFTLTAQPEEEIGKRCGWLRLSAVDALPRAYSCGREPIALDLLQILGRTFKKVNEHPCVRRDGWTLEGLGREPERPQFIADGCWHLTAVTGQCREASHPHRIEPLVLGTRPRFLGELDHVRTAGGFVRPIGHVARLSADGLTGVPGPCGG